jgi:pyrimidine operon attenuation protein/uracil phosphoribosyltransferase
VLVAIPRGGVPVAELIAAQLREITGAEVPLGTLDVTLYRDDVIARGYRPVPRPTRMPFRVAGKRVVLVDDVMFTGRTIRAAMDAILDFGRPAAIQVATLVDRGHRELPIKVDFVGKNVPTARSQQIVLRRDARGELEVVIQ